MMLFVILWCCIFIVITIAEAVGFIPVGKETTRTVIYKYMTTCVLVLLAAGAGGVIYVWLTY